MEEKQQSSSAFDALYDGWATRYPHLFSNISKEDFQQFVLFFYEQEPHLPQRAQVEDDSLIYDVVEAYCSSQTAIPLLPSYFLQRCTDGWYQVFFSNGRKLHMRISAELFRHISHKLKIR